MKSAVENIKLVRALSRAWHVLSTAYVSGIIINGVEVNWGDGGGEGLGSVVMCLSESSGRGSVVKIWGRLSKPTGSTVT